MKKHLFLFFFASFAGILPTNAIQRYDEGDTLFVWAKSGLILRASPDFKAEKISTLPYGTAVKTHSYKYRDEDISEIEVAVVQPYNFNGKNYPGYKIPGLWVKVTAQGKTGYVFDGYLSKYPPANKIHQIPLNTYTDEWSKYLSGAFGESCQSKDTSRHRHTPKFDITFYKNGASRQSRSAGDGVSAQTYMLPELSLEEGFLLANYFYDLEKNSNRAVKTDDPDDAPYLLLESSSNVLDFDSESSFWGHIKIGCVNGVVVITTLFSC